MKKSKKKIIITVLLLVLVLIVGALEFFQQLSMIRILTSAMKVISL